MKSSVVRVFVAFGFLVGLGNLANADVRYREVCAQSGEVKVDIVIPSDYNGEITKVLKNC